MAHKRFHRRSRAVSAAIYRAPSPSPSARAIAFTLRRIRRRLRAPSPGRDASATSCPWSMAMEGRNPAEGEFDIDGVPDSDDVHVVIDSFAGNTEVPDSQAMDVEAMEAAHAILHLHETKVSVFQMEKDAKFVADLMLPIMVPLLYGEHDADVNNAAVNLFWISHGLVRTTESSMIPDEALDSIGF